jgi:hypothetical protein
VVLYLTNSPEEARVVYVNRDRLRIRSKGVLLERLEPILRWPVNIFNFRNVLRPPDNGLWSLRL